jgi:hypothetical protein
MFWTQALGTSGISSGATAFAVAAIRHALCCAYLPACTEPGAWTTAESAPRLDVPCTQRPFVHAAPEPTCSRLVWDVSRFLGKEHWAAVRLWMHWVEVVPCQSVRTLAARPAP